MFKAQVTQRSVLFSEGEKIVSYLKLLIKYFPEIDGLPDLKKRLVS
jgi:hypothetical protein